MKKVEKQNIPILFPRYGISCSYHPRLLSCTSFYRRLISLFLPRTSSAFSGVPRWTHSVGAGVPDGPHRRTFEYRRTLVYPSVGAGVLDGPFFVLRLRAAPASCMFASGGHISFNSERNMEKNAAKNQRFLDFPLSDCNRGTKRSRKESPVLLFPLPLPRAARKLSSLAPYRGSALHPT